MIELMITHTKQLWDARMNILFDNNDKQDSVVRK